MTIPFTGCSHRWVTVSTHYMPAILNETMSCEEINKRLQDNSNFEHYAYGATRIYQQCEKCGNVQELSVLGHFKAKGVEEVV